MKVIVGGQYLIRGQEKHGSVKVRQIQGSQAKVSYGGETNVDDDGYYRAASHWVPLKDLLPKGKS